MINYNDAKQVAAVLAAVGEPTRLQILHRLAQEPLHVGRLAELIGIPMVNVSHHLGVLRQAGLIVDAKQGRRVVYTLRPGAFTPGDAAGVVGSLAAGDYTVVLFDSPNPLPNGTTDRRAG